VSSDWPVCPVSETARPTGSEPPSPMPAAMPCSPCREGHCHRQTGARERPRPSKICGRTYQPCLVCGRTPSHAHHIKFTEQRAMGRKVSDKFTVPICRVHHRELHRRGNERVWGRTGNRPAGRCGRPLGQDACCRTR
jgi:hypothetical protein